MEKTFSEVKLFQVKPGKAVQFELLINGIMKEQMKQPGCTGVKYMKRAYTTDGIAPGQPPKALTKIIKCIKYYSFWEFDSIDNYGTAAKWFSDSYLKEFERLLAAPLETNCGYTL